MVVPTSGNLEGGLKDFNVSGFRFKVKNLKQRSYTLNLILYSVSTLPLEISDNLLLSNLFFRGVR
jgi:hypothetical protein